MKRLVMSGVLATVLAGCMTVDRFGAVRFDGGASEAAELAAIDDAGLGGDILYVGVGGGPDEFPSRSAAQAFLSQHQGQTAVFRGNIMQVSSRGSIDVVHWQPYTRSRACVPNNPVATCFNVRGGIPKTVVRCVGPSLGALSTQTNGRINRSTDYPWTRQGTWDTATITGRVARVTTGSTRVASGVSISSEALADFGSPSMAPRSLTFGFSVIELTGCRLAMFNGQVTGG